MSVALQIEKIKKEIPQNVQLIAVSKTKPVSLLQEAYHAGQRDFGENKIQEMTDKWEQLPKDICWHMIGHVQTNKVKYMAPYVGLIHGVDSLKLLLEINKQAAKNDRSIDCLLQVFIAEEETKFGLNEEELFEILDHSAFEQWQNIRIVGLMGMASYTENLTQIHKEFGYLKTLFDQVKTKYPKLQNFKTLSMGMSGDYEIAIENGSNMVRIGSKIFGSRS
jgi:pyridoxal phosphate enzyme (YggS family)